MNNHKQFFAALSNEGRLEIVNALSNGPLNVSQIVISTGFKQSRVSRSLDCLSCCGFVSAVKNGRERIYKLNDSVMHVLKAIEKHEMSTKNQCKCGVEKKNGHRCDM
ncbi:MAG TPA: metalloregulator ArsR/SmtB family transcription factor [Candidatus Nanoarchaeia archaeon]|nr:metalloregulator ArsR/SmtB family transcription factor [Candidatus Nanoarchaeia archaeon]